MNVVADICNHIHAAKKIKKKEKSKNFLLSSKGTKPVEDDVKTEVLNSKVLALGCIVNEV